MANSKANSNSKPANSTQTNSKPRVISPREVQSRIAQSSQRRPGAPDPSTYISESATPVKRRSRFFSFVNRFRQRYAALPAPVQGTARAFRYITPALAIGMFFSEHILQVMWVRGPSMTPYLNENYAEMQTESDMVLVRMLSPPWSQTKTLERGMVVTFRSPANPSHIAIKRVIGLPGDRIMTREPCPRPSQIVPWNHVWVEGDADDPRKSLDSNTYGPVSISLISGSVVAVLYPRMRRLKWWDWDKPFDNQAGADTEKELGEGYRESVRNRVIKEASKVEAPLSN